MSYIILVFGWRAGRFLRAGDFNRRLPRPSALRMRRRHGLQPDGQPLPKPRCVIRRGGEKRGEVSFTVRRRCARPLLAAQRDALAAAAGDRSPEYPLCADPGLEGMSEVGSAFLVSLLASALS